jgi:signal transduction histidine kinase
VDVFVGVSPIKDARGGMTGMATIARDITERKLAAAERERLLRQEQAARAAAEAALRTRAEFLSVAAHELKTPLTSLLGHAQIALRRLTRSGALPLEEVRSALGIIEQQAIRSARLIAQLFDLVQLEAGTLVLHLEPVDVGLLVDEAAVAAQGTSSRHTVLVDRPRDTAFVVRADPLRLEQVLGNLLDNAIRFSPAGGDVTITVAPDTAVPSSPAIRVIVADQGIGVPPAYRVQLFDRYAQAHAGDHRSGLGLGLHLCREIVERHDGHIAAEFLPEGGTRIVFTLPVDAPGTMTRPGPTSA